MDNQGNNQVQNGQAVSEQKSGDEVKKTDVKREVLFNWESPMRHFKKMDKKKFFMILAIVLAFFVVLVLVQQWWLMAAIAAVMFLVYAWGTVPPAKLEHVITNEGIESAGNLVEWENLDKYWYSQKDDQYILNVDTKLRLPGRLIMLVSDDEMQKTKAILENRLKYKDMRNQDRMSKVVDGVWINMLEEENEGQNAGGAANGEDTSGKAASEVSQSQASVNSEKSYGKGEAQLTQNSEGEHNLPQNQPVEV
jgi:hypothetical protein